ncbi:MAG: hypothetical protein ISR65_01895 [Bacteriovoracaceae bacterium]|nr:hypothetical protein [Bacteriovoracaceae bacterium]
MLAKKYRSKILTSTTVILTLSLHLCPVAAFSQEYLKSAITDPTVSLKCQDSLDERNKKVQHKKKLKILLARNRNLAKQIPKYKQLQLQRLRINYNSILREYYFAKSRIEDMTKDIVMQGCPGLQL